MLNPQIVILNRLGTTEEDPAPLLTVLSPVTKTPISFIPFSLWRWLLIEMARQSQHQMAAAQAVRSDAMLAQPYG